MLSRHVALRIRALPVSYTHLDVYKRQVLVRTHGVLGAGGKLNVVLKAKLLVHGVDEVDHAHDLVGQLVGTHKQVGVVLVKAAHAEQAVQEMCIRDR